MSELIAKAFHEAYERLAPSFGYQTWEASAIPWEDVPENNRQLMIAVAGEVKEHIEHGQQPLLAQEKIAISNFPQSRIDGIRSDLASGIADHKAFAESAKKIECEMLDEIENLQQRVSGHAPGMYSHCPHCHQTL